MKTKDSKTIGWIIKTSKDKYYAIDQKSGGYSYWSSFIMSAKLFSSEKEAIKTVIEGSEFTVGSRMSDGTSFPPRMVHMAADLNNLNPKGTAVVLVTPLVIGEPVLFKKFVGKIARPEEY